MHRSHPSCFFRRTTLTVFTTFAIMATASAILVKNASGQTPNGEKKKAPISVVLPAPPIVKASLYRKPAPRRVAVHPQPLGLPGVSEIPSKFTFSCYLSQDVEPALLQKGDTFLACLDPEAAAPGGSATEWFPPEDTLVVFAVTRKEIVGKETRITCRVREILEPRSETSDYVISVASGNLLFGTGGPTIADVGESARKGAAVAEGANAVLGDASFAGMAKVLGGGLGLATGQLRQIAAGDSVLRRKVKAGSAITVRINIRVLFTRPD